MLAKNFPKVKSCGCAQTRARKKNIQKARETFLNGCVENSSVYCIKPKKMLKNNTSGVRSITYDRTAQKWQAQIVFKGKTYKLGRYIDKEDAIRARKMAEEAMFGNFLKWFQDTYPDRWKRMTNTDSLNMKCVQCMSVKCVFYSGFYQHIENFVHITVKLFILYLVQSRMI